MTFSSEHANALAVSHRRRTIGDVGTIPESMSEWLPYFTRQEYIECTGTTPDGRRVLSHEAAMIRRDLVRSGKGLGRIARIRRHVLSAQARLMMRVADNQQRTHRESQARESLTGADRHGHANRLCTVAKSVPLRVPVPHTDPIARPADQHVHSLTRAANAPGIAA